MTFNQITLKNLRQNIKHYGMFLFSLLLSIVIYYSFTTLKYSHSINNSNSADFLKKARQSAQRHSLSSLSFS